MTKKMWKVNIATNYSRIITNKNIYSYDTARVH